MTEVIDLSWNGLEKEKLKVLRRLARDIIYRKRALGTGAGEWERELIREAFKILQARFPNKPASWFERAIIRYFYVKEITRNTWIVYGIPELGDLYTYYRVYLHEATGKYICSCFNTAFGRVRRKMVCTHIAAVIIYRKVQSILTHYLRDYTRRSSKNSYG